MSKKKVYISGAIAHYDIEERKEAFSHAAKLLKTMGYEPVNPFDNGLPQPGDWHDHMRVDMGMLLDCQYIYMLKGWWVSKGAKLELDVATSCGMKPLFEEDDIFDKEQTCCICGKKFYGVGDDPHPVKEEGVCCEKCNWSVVLPARFQIDKNHKKE